MTISGDQAAIAVHNLNVALTGHLVLENISFTVPAGSTTAIIGPNGAGKSVLIKTILRLLPKQSGEVRIFGVSHEQYRKVAMRISYIPQRLTFDNNLPLTVRGLFTLKSKRLLGLSPEDEQRMQKLLSLVGMEAYRDRQLSQLSGGQMQRVLLGYSLMDTPQLLILDEPSAGIDVQGQKTIYTLLQDIKEREHLTLVLVSHELDVVMQYADHVLCLNRTLLCSGVPKHVLSNELLQQMYGTPVSHFSHTH